MVDKKKPNPGTKAYLQMRLQEVRRANKWLIEHNSTLTRRAAFAHGLGKSFEGDRDLYLALGYKIEPMFADYLAAYEREGIATRLVDAPCDETWREHPVLYVGDEVPDKDDPNELQDKFKDFANEHDLWARFNDLDKSVGISQFGVMFLGLPGDLDQPAKKSDKLFFVSVHDEGDCEIDFTSLVRDHEDPRFGLPEFYWIVVDEITQEKRHVHYSRVIHYKEGKSRAGYGRFMGVPGLKNVLNRLQDLEKVVGGGSEAFWLLIRKGLAITAKEGMDLPNPGTDAYNTLVDEIEEYEHGISRIMKLVGADVTDLGSQPVSSRDQFDVVLAYIAGSKRIPQRILIGSERGQLASGQDEGNWNDYIAWRRVNVAEPYILRAFLKRGREIGFFDTPDNVNVHWPSLFQMDDKEEAQIASTIAQAISTASGGAPETIIPPEKFGGLLPGKYRQTYTPEELAAIEEKRAAEDALNQVPFGGGGGGSNFDQLFAKFPNNGNGGRVRAQEMYDLMPQQVLNQMIEGFNHAVHGKLVRGKVKKPMVLHNVGGVSSFSTMVAFMIPDAIKLALKKQYTWIDPPVYDELHITLCYMGDIRTLDRKRIHDAVRAWAENERPIKLKMQGYARFVGAEMGKDAIVATFDSPGNELAQMRQRLVGNLGGYGVPYHDDHGFIPHMTMAYVPTDAGTPVNKMDPLEINFQSAFVVIGGERFEYPLGVPYPEISSTPTASVAAT